MLRIVSFFLIVFSLPSGALACRCIYADSIEEEIGRVQAVFTATVQKKMLNRAWINEFEIHKAWKGFAIRSNVAWQRIIINPDGCSYTFENAETYLIFADAATKNELGVTYCSKTIPVTEAEDLLKRLGPPEAEHQEIIIGAEN